MHCKQITGWLSEYVDGTLEQTKRDQLEAHIETCAACRDDVTSLRQTLALLNEIESVPPPPDLLQRIHTQISEEDAVQKRSLWLILRTPQAQSAIAASVLITLGLYLFHHTQPTPAQQSADNNIAHSSANETSGDNVITAGKKHSDAESRREAALPALRQRVQADTILTPPGLSAASVPAKGEHQITLTLTTPNPEELIQQLRRFNAHINTGKKEKNHTAKSISIPASALDDKEIDIPQRNVYSLQVREEDYPALLAHLTSKKTVVLHQNPALTATRKEGIDGDAKSTDIPGETDTRVITLIITFIPATP